MHRTQAERNLTDSKKESKLNCSYACVSSHLLELIISGPVKGSKHPVHPYRVVPVVMAIRGVMNGVIGSAHDRPHFAIDAVMNVSSPHAFNEQQNHVCHEVRGYEEESNYMWHCLQYPI